MQDGLRMNRCQTLSCNLGVRMAYSTVIRPGIFSHGSSTLTGESAYLNNFRKFRLFAWPSPYSPTNIPSV